MLGLAEARFFSLGHFNSIMESITSNVKMVTSGMIAYMIGIDGFSMGKEAISEMSSVVTSSVISSSPNCRFPNDKYPPSRFFPFQQPG